METLFADMTVSMSEFKKNPAAVLRRSNNRPVAVMNHHRTAFYMVEPQLFQAMLEELAQLKSDTPAPANGAAETQDGSPVYRAVLARLGARLGALLGQGTGR